MGKAWGGGGSTKTRLAPQTNRAVITSLGKFGKSCELRETLTGGQLHCTNICPAGPGPSLNKTLHKERKGHKNPLFRQIFYFLPT